MNFVRALLVGSATMLLADNLFIGLCAGALLTAAFLLGDEVAFKYTNLQREHERHD